MAIGSAVQKGHYVPGRLRHGTSALPRPGAGVHCGRGGAEGYDQWRKGIKPLREESWNATNPVHQCLNL